MEKRYELSVLIPAFKNSFERIKKYKKMNGALQALKDFKNRWKEYQPKFKVRDLTDNSVSFY